MRNTNKKWWDFKNYATDQSLEQVEEIELKIGGEIVNIPCWEGDVSSNAFKAELDKYPNVKNIKLKINSPGGDVFEAVDIFNELKQHPAKVEVVITGMCASAATLIAMSADKGSRKMCFNGMLMIHNGMSVVQGNAKAMRERADLLDNIDYSVIITTYQQHSNLSEEEIKAMLDKTTWLTAKQALEHGFIDEILDYKVEAEEATEVQNFLRGQVIKNFENVPVGMVKNMLTLENPKIMNEKIEEQEEVTMKSLEELEEKYPEIYNQAIKKGVEEGTITERARLQSIDNLKGDSTILNKAKYEELKDAGEVAIEINAKNEEEKTKMLAEIANKQKLGISGTPEEIEDRMVNEELEKINNKR